MISFANRGEREREGPKTGQSFTITESNNETIYYLVE